MPTIRCRRCSAQAVKFILKGEAKEPLCEFHTTTVARIARNYGDQIQVVTIENELEHRGIQERDARRHSERAITATHSY